MKEKREIFKFIKNVLVLLVVSAASLAAYFAVQYFINKDNNSSFGPELYYALDLAEKDTGYEKVIIGDSVARLIFAPAYQSETEDTCYLATNQAITVLGNYILLNRYLENNPDTKEVIYIARPQSLANPLWYNYSYQYFVVPFYNDKYISYIEDETRLYIEKRFGKLYVDNEFVKNFVINSSAYLDIYLNNVLEQQLEQRDEKHLCGLSAKYLRKMQKLCEEKGIKLTVLAAPLPDTLDNHDWDEFAFQIEAYGLSDLLGDYLQGIEYYDEKYFADEAHFTDEYLEANRDVIIEKLFD